MKGSKIVLLIFVFLHIVYFSSSFKSSNNIESSNPLEINELSKKEFGKKIMVNINQKDPIGYLKLKVITWSNKERNNGFIWS